MNCHRKAQEERFKTRSGPAFRNLLLGVGQANPSCSGAVGLKGGEQKRAVSVEMGVYCCLSSRTDAVALPETRDPVDEIGDVDPEAIGAIVARYCRGVSPSDIIRLVLEVLARKSVGESD